MRRAVFSPPECNESVVDGWDLRPEIPTNKEDEWIDSDFCFNDLFSSVFCQEDAVEPNDEIFGDDFIMPNLEEIKKKFQPSASQLCKPLKPTPDSFSFASLELLNNYGGRFKMSRDEDLNNLVDEANAGRRKLSTDEILRIAGERFIEFSTSKVDGISMFIHPYESSLSGLSMDEARDIELVYLLLSAAENLYSGHFDLVSRLISRCLWAASDSGSPIQRLSLYFADALQQRFVASEKTKSHPEKPEKGLALRTLMAAHQELPFSQTMQLAGMQTIIEQVKTRGKIHLIDLQIRSGIQWTALMQGLAESPSSAKHLKITALVTADDQNVEETGKRLQSFARTLNLSLTFNVVYLMDLTASKVDVLNVEADETLAVYSYMMLRTMISRPDCLDNLMRAIARIKPVVMVVTEVEANHNTSSFADRFIEALFYFSAVFDCLEDCLERNNGSRKVLERTYFGEGIKNIVAAEGEERVIRDVKIEVWRAFLARFGLAQMDVSESSRYQASLVLKQFAKGNSCNLEYKDKTLIVGWKGTPFHSLSAWKFS